VTETLQTPAVDAPDRETAAAALLAQLVAYCHRHGPPHCYRDWTARTIEAYILHHMRQGTFAWVKRETGEGRWKIGGCGIVWQGNERFIRARIKLGLAPFHWQPTDRHGDCLFLEEFVCTAPGALRTLARCFKTRFPRWRELKRLTLKKERLVYV